MIELKPFILSSTMHLHLPMYFDFEDKYSVVCNMSEYLQKMQIIAKNGRSEAIYALNFLKGSLNLTMN